MPRAEPAEPTVTHLVEAAIGDEPFDCAMFAAERNSMAEPSPEWRTVHSVADLPDEPIGGWERLVVFTPDHVYDWTANGMGHQLDRLPRHPDAFDISP